MSTYSIGADIGTTSTKAVLFSETGEIIYQSTVEYPLLTPEPKIAEQDPDEILEAVITAIQNVMKKSAVDKEKITVLSFSAAMHSLIAVDGKGKPLTNSITWADQRAEPYAQQLKETTGKSIYDKTGTPIHPMSPLTKLMWLKAEMPDVFNKARRFIGIKEYIFHHFFGQYVVDHSIASATGLFNMYNMDWDEEALETAGVTRDKLSKIVPTTEVFTKMNDDIAERLGVHPNMKTVIGANDGCLANLGVNAIEKGVVAVSIGTSGALRTVTDKPVADPKGRIFCYALTENHWVIGGPVNNGGMVLRWLRDELSEREVEEAKAIGADPYDVITDKIEKIPAGSNGLLFHPYLSGERAPSWNANSRGSFYGLAINHKREHVMRAVLEGINMNLYMVLLALEEVIGIPDRIHATGGFAKSTVWRQMMANIFNQEVHIPQTVEGACLGAAVLGKYAIGEIDDLREVENMVETKAISVPEKEEVAVYEELMPLYIRLSRLFEQEYDAITEFQQKFK
ncbi:gluconokinase [Alkalibacterium kapii]|uniref:Gluconate kinase n=1 Tax=Alkalibacterium kapii TaxID=426704 RepID=A0A511AS93_9LACT|nr:gluconokinase [Alkalibacterium kapii]GEK91070.1 gluconate kinase [Alkalibacterium kapii]